MKNVLTIAALCLLWLSLTAGRQTYDKWEVVASQYTKMQEVWPGS